MQASSKENHPAGLTLFLLVIRNLASLLLCSFISPLSCSCVLDPVEISCFKDDQPVKVGDDNNKYVEISIFGL